MKVAHMALWTRDLEQQAQFWVTFFDAKINEKYCSKTNPGFESYFVKIGEDIAIELMTKPGLTKHAPNNNTSPFQLAAVKTLMPWRCVQKNRGY